jgi:hypothetical protein
MMSGFAKYLLLPVLLFAVPAAAAPLQQDCRAPGTIGTATMALNGTVTLNLQAPDGTMGAFAYPKSDPNYARIVSHLGGIRPGEHKPVPAFCGPSSN